jgi:hypothetical protein
VTLRRARQALSMHPRVMLVVLLALGLEMMPSAAGLVSHRHAGGDVAHTHAGPIDGVASARAAHGAEDGFHRAPSRDLHQHLVQPALALKDSAPLPPGPALLTTDLPASAAPAEIPAAQRAGQARSPPLGIV